MGDYKTAYQYRLQFESIKDTIFNSENNDKIKNIRLQHVFEKAQDSILLLQVKKDQKAAEKLRIQKVYVYVSLMALLVAGAFALVFFIQRNKIKKAKETADTLLLNILPGVVAQELKDTGNSKARSFDNTSVLFSDFESFTNYSEHITAEQLVAELNTCFKAFDEITSKYNIEKIKTIGDSYMAAAGFGLSVETSASNVVCAALEMQEFVLKWSKDRNERGEPVFSMRLGIHTGPVVAGIVGVKKFAYDIWGDTVNTASRMESTGMAGKVNISSNTYDILKDNYLFDFEYRGKVHAKGKGEIDMYFVSYKKPI